jgi:PAS domain S-box-containing protein
MKYISNSIEELTGYSASDFIDNKVRSFTSIIHHNDREMVDRIVQEGVRNKQPFVIEYRMVSKDGSIRHVHEKGRGVFNKEGELLWLDGAVFDITEQKEMEKELIKVQKLESVGVLAGGIAHDFNNNLQAILGYITMAGLQAGSNNKIREYLNEANKAIFHSKDLTQQLLTFSKGGAPVKTAVSLSELIADSVSLALSGSNARCELGISDDLREIEGDKGQLNQVISNLIINADQAMPEGGNIRVGAENINVADKNLLPLQEGEYVKITIEDQGTGISQENLQKIFDPFFTTKKNGSGLGLATTYSIIKKHDGHITVESELGAGTTFQIYLPASKKEIQNKLALSEAEGPVIKLIEEKDEEQPNGSKGKILLMEDEYVIRTILSKQLRHSKYEVEAAEEGSEAIRLYEHASRAGEPFDAVVMDLTISGGMGGEETIKNLLEVDPEVKAIVVSGYANDPIMANYKRYGFSGVLPKPHGIHELDEALQKVIIENS